MAPDVPNHQHEHTQRSPSSKRGRRERQGRDQPQPRLLQPAPGTPRVSRPPAPADATLEASPRSVAAAPGGNVSSALTPGVRTGAKEGTGAVKNKKKSPCKRRSHRMCV